MDASVRVEGDDRASVERLVRYCGRGPLALERLHAVDGPASLDSADAQRRCRTIVNAAHGGKRHGGDLDTCLPLAHYFPKSLPPRFR